MKKILTVFVALMIMLSAVMVGAVADSGSSLPQTDTTLNFVNDFANSVSKVFDSYGIGQGYQTGLIGNQTPNSYIVYKVEKNSPVVANFKYMPTGSEKPEFFTSEDGTTWNPLTMESYSPQSQQKTYYTSGIGAENKYVKIIICNNAITESWRCSLWTLSYNVSTEADDTLTADTTVDFVKDYMGAMSKAYKCSYDLTQIYNGGIGGGETPKSYIIYRVEKNSPIEAKFKLFTDLTSGRPEFYSSSEGSEWNKLNMIAVKNGNFVTYSISSIGAENKYVKIIMSNVALTAPWHIDLHTLSYKASTETDDLPTPDTTLDFLANGKADLDRVFRNWNFAISPDSGYKNAAFALKPKNNYIVINTADNSPFSMNMRVHDSVVGEKVTLLVSNNPNDADSWIPLDATRIQPKNPGYNSWSFYTTGIGEGYTYVKISLSSSSPWAYCIENISYSAGAHIGPDDSGYVEPDPDDKLPKTDTKLDFVSQYNVALNNAYMFSPDLHQIWQGGIGGSKTPESYMIYKVDKNSPIIATFKIFANDTKGRPQFFASPDGKTWEPVILTAEEEIKGTMVVRYISEGIGKENRFFKVVISDTQLGVSYYCDLHKLEYNKNTEPSPYDLNLSFSSDALALARVYKITPPEAFEHLLGTGLILTVDYLSGKKEVVKPRVIIAVKENSGFLAEFKVSIYAKALDMFPKLYASKDGEKWDELDKYEIFSTGSNATHTSYRIMIDSLDSKYEFVSFEYPQTKDYAGIDIAELDDYIPDCLNSGIILTKISFKRSDKYVGLATDDTAYNDEDEENNGNISSPQTGDRRHIELHIILVAVSLFAVILLGKKTRKGSKV